jgi:GTPase KRas protein
MIRLENSAINVVLLGNYGVGKSCITLRFLLNFYSPEYQPTVEEKYTKTYIFNQKKYILNIMDTSGVDHYCTAQDNWIEQSDSYILIYSIADRDSFEKMSGVKNRVDWIKNGEGTPKPPNSDGKIF